jgi:hypothetical protein
MAIRADPNPESPWINPAVKNISAIHINVIMACILYNHPENECSCCIFPFTPLCKYVITILWK